MLGPVSDMARLDSAEHANISVSTTSGFLKDYCLKLPMDSVCVSNPFQSANRSQILTHSGSGFLSSSDPKQIKTAMAYSLSPGQAGNEVACARANSFTYRPTEPSGPLPHSPAANPYQYISDSDVNEPSNQSFQFSTNLQSSASALTATLPYSNDSVSASVECRSADHTDRATESAQNHSGSPCSLSTQAVEPNPQFFRGEASDVPNYPHSILRSSVEEITAHLRTLHNSRNGIDELHLHTEYLLCEPSGVSEEPVSLEISSETQHAMESSDSTPPSAGRTHQTDNITRLPDGTVCAPVCSPDSVSNWNALRQFHPDMSISIKPINSPANSVKEELRGSSPGNAFIDGVQDDKDCPNSLSNGSEPNSSGDDSDEGMSMARFEQMTNSAQPDQTGVYFCHLCEFTGRGRQEFQDHLRAHYDYKCLKCDYTSRTEGRLKRHLKDFHSEVPPENFSGKALRPVRPKLQRCKQCDFMTETKDEFWRHLRIHIKEDKRLECSLCCFVTEYKHHLEYHMRNHTGTKPYKCPKCNYECVNKSMLNSHMKSHSNIYPYRCANCHYATKYCHSLKLHLSKHDHKPAVVLNADGSLPTYDNTTELINLRRGSNFRHVSYRSRSNCSPQGHQNTLLSGHAFPNFGSAALNTIQHSLMMRELINGTGKSQLIQDNLKLTTSQQLPSLALPCPLSSFPTGMFANPLFESNNIFPGIINSPQISGSFTGVEEVFTAPVLSTTFSADNFSPPTESGGILNAYSRSPCFNNSSTPMMAAFWAALHQNALWTPPPPPHPLLNGTQNHAKPVGADHAPSSLAKGGVQHSFVTSSPCAQQNAPRANSVQGELKNGTTTEQSVSDYALDLSSKVITKSFTEAENHNNLDNGSTKIVPKSDNRQNDDSLLIPCDGPTLSLSPNEQKTLDKQQFLYECRFCEIRFKQRALYDIHMGFHSHTDPYLCNRCGHKSHDPVDFFIHLGQMAHYS